MLTQWLSVKEQRTYHLMLASTLVCAQTMANIGVDDEWLWGERERGGEM